ncbi:sensor histidine kinase [Lichenihabitans psoromatis]|uniref:sensor histidine kinase n=1 Tax=Lichenihabitans psoromatis TaxID=2528642 RepID=UPI0013F14F8A|nr:ATP-binding protein [Lichenihabitans psoromatis]
MMVQRRRGPGAILSRFTLKQTSTLMGSLGLVLIILTSSFIVWHERQTLFEEAEAHAEQSAYFLADHAKRLFEVSDIALHATLNATAGRDWDNIEQSKDLGTDMRSMNAMLPYVDDIWLVDETGRVRRATVPDLPTIVSMADRAVFRNAQQAGDKLIIGEPIVGRVSHKPTFLVARRIEAADGRFRGLVAASMALSYFTDYWQRLDVRNDERIDLIRDGTGEVLARYPDLKTMRAPHTIGPSVLAAAALAPDDGTFEPGPHQFGYYHRVGDLPVFVAVVFRDGVIDARWRAWLWRFIPYAAGAFVALAGIMMLGRRLARRESRSRREVEAARAMLSASNTRLEQRVAERTADLQETNREVQRFAYIVSHDLRAPLVNIMGFTSELDGLRGQLFAAGSPGARADAPDTVKADFDEAIGFIQSSIDKMDRLIKAILSLSRQGQRHFRPEALDMDRLMRSIADGVAHRVQRSGATITIAPLPRLIADRIAVEQVFSNLVENAVKYPQPGVPGRIHIAADESATTVTFEVSDNGRGIEPQDRERVFELFRRAGQQDEPGEGIGLANVRSLVRRLQGTIRLDSKPGLGSVFTVVLPKAADMTEDDGSS